MPQKEKKRKIKKNVKIRQKEDPVKEANLPINSIAFVRAEKAEIKALIFPAWRPKYI